MSEYLIIDIETADLEFEDQEVQRYLLEKNIIPALHPYFSRIVAIGVKPAGRDAIILHGDDEAEILTEFWKLVKGNQMAKIVTFNGYGFDIPFINARSVLNGISPGTGINLNKWNMGRSNHFDIMQAMSMTGNFKWVSLEMTARVLGVLVPADTIPSADMPKLFKEGDWASIVKHNKHDLEMTEAIYLKIKDMF